MNIPYYVFKQVFKKSGYNITHFKFHFLIHCDLNVKVYIILQRRSYNEYIDVIQHRAE